METQIQCEERFSLMIADASTAIDLAAILKNPEIEDKYKENDCSRSCFDIHRLAIQICGIFFVFLREHR